MPLVNNNSYVEFLMPLRGSRWQKRDQFVGFKVKKQAHDPKLKKFIRGK